MPDFAAIAILLRNPTTILSIRRDANDDGYPCSQLCAEERYGMNYRRTIAVHVVAG